MNKSPRSLVVSSAILCTLLIAETGLPFVSTKEIWTSVRSRNFNLVGNASERDIRQVAARMEQFREVFSKLFPGLVLASPVPTTVIVFKNDNSFKLYKPVADGKMVDAAGYFQSGRDVNYIALTIDSQSEDPFLTIFHEYVHLLVNNTIGRASIPPWFNEGLAEYYSTLEVENSRKVYLGKPQMTHLELLRNNNLMPLGTLLSTDYHSLERNKHDERGLFYAQAWVLVHYLIQGSEGRRRPHLKKFLDLLQKNSSVDTAFREAFQMDYTTLERQLREYVKRKSYRVDIAYFDKPLEFDSTMSSSRLTEAEGQAYLGDLLFHTQRNKEATVKLKEALALDPELAMAHASLGMALMEQKRLTDAKQHLKRAVGAKSANFLAHYYYAFVLSREGMDADEVVTDYSVDTARIMRAELQKSIDLKPDFAESYHLLAFIDLVRNENLDDALELIQKAISLSPGTEEYVFVLTQIHVRKQDFVAARRVIEPLAESASDSRIRNTAQGLLNSIVKLQERAADYQRVLTASQGSNVNGASQFSDAQEGAQVNSYAYLDDALRKPKAGEKRVQGFLNRIDCSKGIIFNMKAADRVLKFSARKLEDLTITTFTGEVSGELTCGVRKTPEWIILTYKPAPNTRAKTEGEPVAIEFVPKDFKLARK
jgi:tetratricopeptide (TPR) repeat protein